MKQLTIAIDGPAGAGKSTVAQMVARQMNFTYIDTGAMYRAVAFMALENGIDPSDSAGIEQTAQQMKIHLSYLDGKTFIAVNSRDVTSEIRTPEVTALVAAVAQLPGVRKAMTNIQREMGRAGGVVMDGRDIGTHVLPEAEVKIFLTASIEERAKRRWRELTEKGYEISLEQLKLEIKSRDEADSQREIAPLIQAKDAVLLDTTNLSIAEAVARILDICEEKTRAL